VAAPPLLMRWDQMLNALRMLVAVAAAPSGGRPSSSSAVRSSE
jgi:hypothetical protein